MVCMFAQLFYTINMILYDETITTLID
jgi:hypothetical protein